MASVSFSSFPSTTTTTTTTNSKFTSMATATATSFCPPTKFNPTKLVKNPIQRRSRSNESYHRRPLGVRMSSVELKPSTVLMSKAEEFSDSLRGTSIFLIGMNCMIKTNAAKVLAKALRYFYFDSDSLVVEAAESKLDAKSLRRMDETEFDDAESAMLKELSSIGRLVVCAGDGAVRSATNLAYLRHGISIWIDVPLDVLEEEILKSETPQPVSKNASKTDSYIEVQDNLAKHYQELKEGYLTADATVSLQRLACERGYDDLDMVTPEDVALEVLKQIEKLTRVKKMMEEAARPF